MSVLKTIISIFSQKEPVEASADAGHEEGTTDSATPAPTSPDNVIYIYSHGFTNGVYQIEPDKDSFSTFLEHCNQVDRIKELRLLKEKTIAEAELNLSTATALHATSIASIVEKARLAENISLSLTELGQRRVKIDQKQSALSAQAKETILEYAWLPALFYFAAGIIFIVADISITNQITTWGFNMSGWQGWAFALGLAFTAFLIKPAIDRLLEKPFQAAGLKLQLLYKVVLLCITLLGLTMLYFLGRFRSDSEIARIEMNEIMVQIDNLESGSPKIGPLQSQYDAIQQSLNTNKLGQSGLVLSGILFAIGGAICLSISFGSLQQLINRYWILPIRIRHLKAEFDKLSSYIDALRSEHTTMRIDQEKAEKILQTNDVGNFKKELLQLQEERAALLDQFYQAQHARETALYLDGKNKGNKYHIQGDLVYEVKANDQSAPYLSNQRSKEKTQSSHSTRPYTRRPFVKIRKMIADNFNKNQNNLTYDGTEFEIVP